MPSAAVERIAKTLLYEGYLLYPYRPSNVKNNVRWTFGSLYPQSYVEACNPSENAWMQTECLVVGGTRTRLDIQVRFLHILSRRVGELSQAMSYEAWEAALSRGNHPSYREVDSLQIDGHLYQTWQEATERTITTQLDIKHGTIEADHSLQQNLPFAFPAQHTVNPLGNSEKHIVGVSIREQQAVEGELEMKLTPCLSGPIPEQRVFRLTVGIRNLTPLFEPHSLSRDVASGYILASTHTILTAHDGEFLSLLDPPAEYRDIASTCRNIGTWPVLVGDRVKRDSLLSSPIILYDYPQIAPESPQDFFDGTEIDEMLTLRIRTLTDQEKREMSMLDERARRLLGHTEGLADESLARLHGARRGREEPIAKQAPPDIASSHPAPNLQPGDRVRLRPHGRADAFDLLLQGKVATIESIEEDFEGRFYLAVTIDEDPGRDLGMQGKPGHRFYFHPDEVELLAEDGER